AFFTPAIAYEANAPLLWTARRCGARKPERSTFLKALGLATTLWAISTRSLGVPLSCTGMEALLVRMGARPGAQATRESRILNGGKAGGANIRRGVEPGQAEGRSPGDGSCFSPIQGLLATPFARPSGPSTLRAIARRALRRYLSP